MRRLLIALQFLTRIPVRLLPMPTLKEVGASAGMFPVAGLALGLILAFFYLVLARLAVIHAFFRGAGLAVAGVLATGGLHLDGLMDTADGFGSHAGKERTLAIMKDSRVGAQAVMAAAGLLLLKTGALASLRLPAQAFVLVLMPVFARWTALWLVATRKHAETAEGLGSVVMSGAGRKELSYGSLCCLIILGAAATLPVALGMHRAAYWQCLFLGGGLWLAAGLTGASLARAADRKIGGLTGDVIGAAVELSELAAVILGAALTGAVWMA